MKTSIKNVEIFNESVALIFAELYENFPVPTSLNYTKLASRLFKDDETVDADTILDVFINTITWLKNSGYIWLSSESELEVFGATLNPKGLEVLKIIVQHTESGSSIGERLVDTINQSTREERSELIKTALTEGIKLP